jgi:hypothetical protein
MKTIKNRILKFFFKIYEYLKSDFKLSRSSNKNYPKYCKIASEDDFVFQITLGNVNAGIYLVN